VGESQPGQILVAVAADRQKLELGKFGESQHRDDPVLAAALTILDARIIDTMHLECIVADFHGQDTIVVSVHEVWLEK
jgi:hypothetical protein